VIASDPRPFYTLICRKLVIVGLLTVATYGAHTISQCQPLRSGE
jgi:hypothetical protein